MRNLIVSELVSLDGYVEGPGKNFMVMPLHPCFDAYNAELLDDADVLLLGARTYRMFATFWPDAVGSPVVSGEAQHLARRDAEVRKLVVSDSLTDADIVNWGAETELVRRTDAHDRIRDLKERHGQDIVVVGSRTLANDLLAAGLVDEVHLVVGPDAIGAGTSFFATPLTGLRLIGTQTFDDADHVVLRYAVG